MASKSVLPTEQIIVQSNPNQFNKLPGIDDESMLLNQSGAQHNKPENTHPDNENVDQIYDRLNKEQYIVQSGTRLNMIQPKLNSPEMNDPQIFGNPSNNAFNNPNFQKPGTNPYLTSFIQARIDSGNPTGQNRIPHEENVAMQNVVGEENDGTYRSCQICYGCCCGFLCTYICCCSSAYQQVPESHSGVIQRFGKFHKLVGPGLYYLNPEVDSLRLVDKREKAVGLKSQRVVTKDNVTVTIDAVLFYMIADSLKSVYAVQNLETAVYQLSLTTLRNVIGIRTLQQLLLEKEEIDDHIKELMEEPSIKWGCKVTKVLILDLLLPKEIREGMSTAATAKKIGEGKVIGAQAGVQSALLLREAADALNSDAAMQIRFVDTLEVLSKSKNPKLVFFPSKFEDF